MLLELQKSSRMKDLRLSGRRGVNPWELTLHARSPLATHQVTPGNHQGLGRSLPDRERKTMNAILVELHLSRAKMIAFIGSLKDDTCAPKPAKLNAWVYI